MTSLPALLAHLARRDAWANLFQIIVETVLFYHPVVWWIGSRARIERENAADDLAVRVCTDRLIYAGALAQLAEWEAPTQSLGLAATDGSLFARIRRVLGRPSDRETGGAAWIVGGVAIAACIGTALLTLGTPVTAADEEKRIRVAAGESIQTAIDAAPSGAVIQLGEGEWKERIVISKPLTIEGAGYDKTRITIEEPPTDETSKANTELDLRRKATTTREEKNAVATEWVQRVVRPAITVRDARGVKLRGLRVQGLSQRGPNDGGTFSALVYFQRAQGMMSECAVVGPFGNGIQIAAESDVEIRRSLIAAIWSEGIVVHGRGRDGSGTPGRLHLVESEVRNVYHYGVAIGRGCDSTVIERCSISGSAWHGIRYDDASPTITGNTIFAHARSGIYASGKTRATVRGNLFWKNQMDGISCWFDNTDVIEENTFVGNLREGLAVIGGSKPTVTRNIFAHSPVAVACSITGGRNGQASAVGEPAMSANLFWGNKTALQVKDETKPAPEGSIYADPQFREPAKQDFALATDSPAKRANIGVAEPLVFGEAWPLFAEERSIIPADETREFNKWTAPGEAKKSKQ